MSIEFTLENIKQHYEFANQLEDLIMGIANELNIITESYDNSSYHGYDSSFSIRRGGVNPEGEE